MGEIQVIPHDVCHIHQVDQIWCNYNLESRIWIDMVRYEMDWYGRTWYVELWHDTFPTKISIVVWISHVPDSISSHAFDIGNPVAKIHVPFMDSLRPGCWCPHVVTCFFEIGNGNCQISSGSRILSAWPKLLKKCVLVWSWFLTFLTIT